MSSRRSLSWSSALRDMRADRIGLEERRAIFAAQHAAKIEAMQAKRGAARKLWTADDGFDRRAIMAAAVADARCYPALPWRKAMSRALTDAWNAARAARQAGSH